MLPQKPDESFTPLTPDSPEPSGLPKFEPEALSQSNVDVEPSSSVKMPGGGTPDTSPVDSAAPITAVNAAYVAAPSPEPVSSDIPLAASEPIEPVNVSAPVEPAMAPVPTVVSGKKSVKKLVLVIVAAVIVLLALGGAIAFAVWNNSPEKILSDSFSNLLNTPPKSADATAAVDVNDTNFKLGIIAGIDGSDNSQTNIKFDVASSGTAVNANVDVISTKNGDLYVRVNDAKKLVAQFTQGSPDVLASFDGILKKVDTKWVKITEADIKKLTSSEKSTDTECANNAINTFQKNDAQKSEVRNLYVKNQFVTVKEQKADQVVNGRNSYHYILDANATKAKSFGEGIKQTQIYKKVADCLGDSFKNTDKSTSSSTDDDTVASVEIWIDKSNRQITKLNLTSSSAKEKGVAKIDAILGYGTRSIVVPTTTTSLDDIMSEVQGLSLVGSPSDSLGGDELAL